MPCTLGALLTKNVLSLVYHLRETLLARGIAVLLTTRFAFFQFFDCSLRANAIKLISWRFIEVLILANFSSYS